MWDSLDLGFRYLGVGWFKFGIRGREGRFNVRLRCKFCKTKVGKGQVRLGAVGLYGCMCGVFSCLHSESVSPASCLDVKERKSQVGIAEGCPPSKVNIQHCGSFNLNLC